MQKTETATANDEWDRLSAVIEWKRMSIPYFARYIGLPNAYVIYALKYHNDCFGTHFHFTPRLKNLADRIVRACPEINRRWLESGEGEMFREGFDFS